MFSLKFCRYFSTFFLLMSFSSLNINAQENVDTLTSTPSVTTEATPEITEVVKPVEPIAAKVIKDSLIDSFIGVTYIPKATWTYPKFLNYEKDSLALNI